MVIAGSTQEHELASTSKVPLLGDLPLLGYLFKYSTRSKRKSNLVIMVTPHIIKDPLEVERIRERTLREHDEFARSMQFLDGLRYFPEIDYGRKRGLVEEINRSVEQVEAERAALDALHSPAGVTPGAVQ